MNRPSDEHSSIDQLTEALVNLPVPEGPDPEVKQNLLKKLKQTSHEPRTIRPQHSWRGLPMRKVASIAATVLVVLGIASYLAQTNSRTSGAAFAAMLQNIDKIRTVKFTTDIVMPENHKLVCRSVVLEPGWMHQSIKTDDLDYVQIIDFSQARMLTLFHNRKRAELMEFSDMPQSQRQKNYIDDFRHMKDEDAVYLGTESIEGVSALKYRYDKAGDHSTLWLDPDTNLPVQVVSTETSDEDAASMSVTLRDFEWNAAVDESLFSLEVPAGYELGQQAAEVGDSSAEDFVMMLRFFVRLNEDQFPNEFGTMMFLSLPKMLLKGTGDAELSKEEKMRVVQERLAYALDRPDIVGMSKAEQMQLGIELQQPFGRGAMFYETTKQTHHWHFDGQGVKLGEADKIVAWWYPKEGKADEGADLDTAHVLYGDLRIETMPVEQLPEKAGK